MNNNATISTLKTAIGKDCPMDKECIEVLAVVAVSDINDAVMRLLDYAKVLSGNILALHVSTEPTEKTIFATRWKFFTNVPLSIIDSPKELSSNKDMIAQPIKHHIEELLTSKLYRSVAVIIPENTSKSFRHSLTGSATARSIKNSLSHVNGVVIVNFPFSLGT
ncbi:hypothetical protein [Candidatus Magnetominusculus dajiuhuensis]|uniref:hypothetical protein n=1 Tax=Candidatus Magnetominusculus dajiuhuensis TaxID=3137712 RepID=UPI003B43C7A9